MDDKKSISDFTEAEFLAFVKKIFNPNTTTEDEDVQNVLEFERLTEHPDGSDVIFYPPKDREDSPEGVVKEVKEWRAKNGKPGFKDS
ncbi:bacteriocin immunity protein [Klebsiella variicola]|uniref:Colicin immunity protein/pyocin immunity protein n=2 Tax=Klebsiella/Raoultella group TaxID=2890311 RepID=A0A0H3FUD1_KLEAK|nr:colicin immunity protein/pyocin immunity protein [Klebsiella aerogenes KCTC 2190]ALD08121.1 colicin immunity protein [Klebsiella quasipneumoniae]KLE69805.1 colicin immunity protein [Klebsiella aerogenes]MBQ5288047.1 bacteriocin immunity protein [Klebsiella pneumoniae]MBZ7295998.1 bacteriocin immunity protein [Klebsiella variicola]NIG24582.1 bacteriocin immunity protein [Klebsiella sp. Acro-834]NIG38144.1 bacteriocin immunity protein [Klebsiella sp. Acro-833]